MFDPGQSTDYPNGRSMQRRYVVSPRELVSGFRHFNVKFVNSLPFCGAAVASQRFPAHDAENLHTLLQAI